jgi:hypothetical protein
MKAHEANPEDTASRWQKVKQEGELMLERITFDPKIIGGAYLRPGNADSRVGHRWPDRPWGVFRGDF